MKTNKQILKEAGILISGIEKSELELDTKIALLKSIGSRALATATHLTYKKA